MRIAYVALHLEKRYLDGGVGQKILSQIGAWEEMGQTARLFLHTPDGLEHPSVSLFRFAVAAGNGLAGRLAQEWTRSQALAALIEAVAAFRPDVIYLRYGLFTLPLPRLFGIAPVVVEINTDDVREYRQRGWFYYQINRLTRRQILGRAAGFCPVSHEIAGLTENQAFHKPVCVIGNGIDLRACEPLPAPRHAQPSLLFVGTPMPWHGVEKLVGLARTCPELSIHVAGYTAGQLGPELPPNLHVHGFLSQAQVRDLLADADVACGTLALHNKSMDEASPLKVREALGHGVPVLLGYRDTDLADLQCDFIYQIPNTPDNVQTHAAQIRDFCVRMQGRRADRAQVADRIDIHVKEEKRLKFLSAAAQHQLSNWRDA